MMLSTSMLASSNTKPATTVKALDFEDAVSKFITHMKAAHNVNPLAPTLEHSRLVGNVWHLSNEQGPLSRVNAQGVVS